MFDWLSRETMDLLGQGIGLTVGLTAVTTLLSLLIGILMGTMRLSERRLWQRLGGLHVEIFRNIPALVLIIFWAFAVPNLFPQPYRQTIFFDNSVIHWLQAVTGLTLPYYVLAAAWGLILNTSAYLAELFRAGVGTIARNHLEAARTLGATPGVVFWHILLPQGLRAAFPAISTRLIHNMKNTALAAFVAVPEFFQQTQTAVSQTFRAIQFLMLAAVVYLCLSLLFSALLRRIDSYLNARPAAVRVT